MPADAKRTSIKSLRLVSHIHGFSRRLHVVGNIPEGFAKATHGCSRKTFLHLRGTADWGKEGTKHPHCISSPVAAEPLHTSFDKLGVAESKATPRVQLDGRPSTPCVLELTTQQSSKAGMCQVLQPGMWAGLCCAKMSDEGSLSWNAVHVQAFRVSANWGSQCPPEQNAA